MNIAEKVMKSASHGKSRARTSISMSDHYWQKVKEGAERLGISQSELIRRAIDDYLAKVGLHDLLVKK